MPRIRAAGISSVDAWIRWMQAIPDDPYSWIEQPAYEFAGAVAKARKAGVARWAQSGDAAREYIASSICRAFGVSSQIIEKRIEHEGLWPPA